MNPNSNPSLGTGSTLLGGAGPAMNAMQLSGGVSGGQTQMSPSAAGFDPSLQQPAYPPMPDHSPMSMLPNHPLMGQIPLSGVMPSQGVLEPKETEAQTILRAFENRLKHLSKHEAFVSGMA